LEDKLLGVDDSGQSDNLPDNLNVAAEAQLFARTRGVRLGIKDQHFAIDAATCAPILAATQLEDPGRLLPRRQARDARWSLFPAVRQNNYGSSGMGRQKGLVACKPEEIPR